MRSTVLRLVFHPADPPVRDPQGFEALVKAVFSQRRKSLANAMRARTSRLGVGAAAVLSRAHIDGARRPETLTVAEFARLADACSQEATAAGRPVL